jgi:hypothetical protein
VSGVDTRFESLDEADGDADVEARLVALRLTPSR